MIPKAIYRCTICGTEGEWTDSWSGYATMAVWDTCPQDVPIACSSDCYQQLVKKVDSGEFQLPKLTVCDGGYNWRVSRPRQGY